MIFIIFGILIGLFIIVSILPLMYYFYINSFGEKKVEYEFPKDLFSQKMHDTEKVMPKFERKEIYEKGHLRMDLHTRGSVRMAIGNILTKEDMEEKRKSINSLPL